MEENLFNQNQSKQIGIYNFEGKDIRTITINNNIWFMASDVTKILEYSNGRDAINRYVNPKDVEKLDTLTKGGNQKITYINESGIYSLVLDSSMPRAKVFRNWITSEVLPSIRKTGSYSIKQSEFKIPQTYAEALRLAADQADLIEEQNKKIQEDKPKVEYYNIVKETKQGIHIGNFAKTINWNPNKLFKWLRDNDYFYYRNGENIPYQKYIDAGFFEVRQNADKNSKKIYSTPLITGKGQIYFTNKLK